MGYGLEAKEKRKLLAASRMQRKDSKDKDEEAHDINEYKTGVLDVAAVFRKNVPRNLGVDTPPFNAVQRIFMPRIHQFTGLKTIIFCFDSPHLIPEIRKKFHVERRYSAATHPPKKGEIRCPEDGRNYKKDEYPPSQTDIDGLTIDSMPKPWASFWNSAKGKFAIWGAIEASIKEYLTQGRGRKGVQYIIDCQDGRRWCYPAPLRPIKMPIINYGEGDTKCLMWGTHYSRFDLDPVLIMTVDWDVVLALLLYAANIHVWLGTVYVRKEHESTIKWYDPDLVQLTKRGAKNLWGEANSRQILEIMEIPKLIERIPNRLDRQHLLMMALCSGGVDYCFGLKDYGFADRDMVSLLIEQRDTGFPTKWMVNLFDPADPYRRYLRFYPGLFIAVIEPIWNITKSKYLTLEAFSEEIVNILFCVTYFNGFDSQRKPGGPPIPKYHEIDMFEGFFSMSQLLDGIKKIKASCEDPTDALKAVIPPYTIREDYPADATTLPHSPEISYSGEQLESIQSLKVEKRP